MRFFASPPSARPSKGLKGPVNLHSATEEERERRGGRPERLLTPTLSSTEEEREKTSGHAAAPGAHPARRSCSPPLEGGERLATFHVGRGDVGCLALHPLIGGKAGSLPAQL